VHFGDDYNVERYVNVENGQAFVVLGAHVRLLTPINSCHSNAKLCMNIEDVYFGKREMFLDVHVNMALCSL
jgi:hypothetical protein